MSQLEVTTPPAPPASGPEQQRPSRRALWRQKVRDPQVVVGVVMLVVLGYLILYPLVLVVLSSIRTPGQLPFDEGTSWVFGNYADVVTAPHFGHLLLDTILVSVVSMAIAFTISVLLAWLIERTDLPFRNTSFVLVVTGLGLPGFIVGIAWVILANPTNGLLNELLREIGIGGGRGPLNVYTFAGFVIVQGIVFVPSTFLLVAAAFRGMDARLEEAAGVSGAGTLTTLRKVTLPLLWPALLGALIFMFITVVESFDIPLTLGLRAGINTLSSQVYLDLHPAVGFPNYAFASVHGVMLLVLSVAPLVYYNRVIGRSEQFATITGRGVQRAKTQLGKWKWPAFAFVVLYVTVSLVLPTLVMVWTSLQPFYALPSAESIKRISLDAYSDALSGGPFATALKNTVLVVFAAGLLAMVIGLVTSWIVVRAKSRAKAVLDVLAFLPHVFPTPVLALSLLLIYIASPLPIYGTVWIVVIALATRYIALSTRFMNAGITSIHRELEEAAAVSGASWAQVMRKVVLPLVVPSFGNGFVMVALLAINQLAMPLILASSSNGTLSTLVWGRWASGDTAAATALAVVMIAITFTIAVAGRRFGRAGSE
jgi:iron(III) transport system permease protein